MAAPRPADRSDVAATPKSDEEVREQTHKAIAAAVTEILNKGTAARVSNQLGRSVLEAVTEVIFTVAMRQGYFRFPDGYGSLKVQRLKADPKLKRLPTGEMVPMPTKRVRLRYEEGAAVREALGLPPKTNYVRRYRRGTRLGPRAQDILTGPGETV